MIHSGEVVLFVHKWHFAFHVRLHSQYIAGKVSGEVNWRAGIATTLVGSTNQKMLGRCQGRYSETTGVLALQPL